MKPQFVNTPPEVKEQVEEAIKAEERKEKRKLKAKEEPPKPMEWWIHQILFYGMMAYIIIISIMPLLRAIKYYATNNANIQFTKNHPNMTDAMRVYYEAKVKTIETDMIDAFK